MECSLCQRDSGTLYKLPVLSPFAVDIYRPTGTIPQILHYKPDNDTLTPVGVNVPMNELFAGRFCEPCAAAVNAEVELPAEPTIKRLSAVETFRPSQSDAMAATRWAMKTLIMQGAANTEAIDTLSARYLGSIMRSLPDTALAYIARSTAQRYAMPITLSFGSTDGYVVIGALGLPNVCLLIVLGTTEHMFGMGARLVQDHLHAPGPNSPIQRLWPYAENTVAWPPTAEVDGDVFPNVIRAIKNNLQIG